MTDELIEPIIESENELDTINSNVINYNSDVRERILLLDNLEDNWDGNGGVPPSDKAIFNSKLFWMELPEFLKEHFDAEMLTPTPYGTIVFEWSEGHSFISVEIGDTHFGFFSELPNNVRLEKENMKFNPNKFTDELASAFLQLYPQSL